MVLGAEGKRMAKRDRPTAVGDLFQQGMPAAVIVGQMAASLGLLPNDVHVMPPELIDTFAFERISQEPWTLQGDGL